MFQTNIVHLKTRFTSRQRYHWTCFGDSVLKAAPGLISNCNPNGEVQNQKGPLALEQNFGLHKLCSADLGYLRVWGIYCGEDNWSLANMKSKAINTRAVARFHMATQSNRQA